MRFTIVSHACMLVEHDGKRLITDPWLSGSAYWRSWWHFPEALDIAAELSSVGWIYLTHAHFDHFHYPSLRRFSRDVTVLIPRFPTRGMDDGLAALGFRDVVAMPHGKTLRLEGGLRVTSYQAGIGGNDSALVVEGGGRTLLNLNDCKLPDRVLRGIAKRHAPIDFVFRSHSSAQAYPECYSSPRQEDLQLRRRSDYVRDFINAARLVEARYAVPFASNVCFLHPDTRDKNEGSVDPTAIAAEYRRGPGDPEIVVMLPGARWDEEEGFTLAPTDVLEHRDGELERLAAEAAPRIAAQAAHEAQTELRFETFFGYMGSFLRSLPLALRLVYRAKVAYVVANEYWVLDFARAEVTRTRSRPPDVASITTVSPGLLQDALEKSIVNFIDISKRLHVELAPGRALDHFVFRQLLTLYEEGYFPLSRSISARFVTTWIARLPELMAYFEIAVRRGRGGLIPKTDAPSASPAE